MNLLKLSLNKSGRLTLKLCDKKDVSIHTALITKMNTTDEFIGRYVLNSIKFALYPAMLSNNKSQINMNPGRYFE